MNDAFKKQLRRIAENKDGKYLDHHEITVIAHGLLSIFDDINAGEYREDVELFLKMLSKHHAPHHARCVMAQQCLKCLEEGESKKLEGSGQMTPENF